MSARPGLGYRLLQRFLLTFFRAFYLFEARGLENVPASGAVIVAANHINVFDALMIAAVVPRRMRFVAWNRTFTMPVIGWFMRASGCIPIDREKPDMAAFKQSLRWLADGNVLGIFPEGKYTTDGHLMPVKQGTARIALAAGATVVPATITGNYRAWPSSGPAKKMFPRPWKVSLKFHPPFHVAPADVREAARELTEKIVGAINSILEPAVRAEEKVDRLVAQPASHIRIYEWFLCVVLLATRQLWAAVVAGVYFVHQLADIYLIQQSLATRIARNFSPLVALALAYPALTRALGLPAVAGVALDWWSVSAVLAYGYVVWVHINYCFAKYLQFQRLVRGSLLTLYGALLALLFLPVMRQPLPLVIQPGVVAPLVLFVLVFDFAHERNRFWAALPVALNAWVAAIVARRYPVWFAALSGVTVALVFAYMNLFKFRAHDGRRI